MRSFARVVVVTLFVASASAALAQDLPPPGGSAPAPAAPTDPAAASAPADPGAATPPATTGPRPPRRGDFAAGGQLRLPSGPDEMGAFASFNWVAVDAIGRYYLLDTVTVTGRAPLAIIHPDTVGGAVEPSMIGGVDVALRAALPGLPKGPFAPTRYKTDVALTLSGAYARAGAMLLGPKDYPLFVGDFEPGLTAGLEARVKLSSLVDFVTTPVWIYQRGDAEAVSGVQLPMTAVVALGSLVKVSADVAINTGDDYAFGADDGGRIAAGGSLTVKLGPILTHVGAGTASLLPGGVYPTVKDGFYLDLDVKYAK
jgi:hypothetical protein